jgi:L-threonylcarbamoyladenylate synthase
VVHVGSRHDLTTVAPRLYAGLRELDAAGVDLILVLGFPADTGLGLAIRDRLRRAASRVLTPRAADTFPRGTQPRSDEAG